MSLSNSLSKKFSEFGAIFASSRMCPDRIRRTILNRSGWKVAQSSVVRWGVDQLCDKVIVGDHSYIGHRAFIDGMGTFIVESHVRIGGKLTALTTTHPIQNDLPRAAEGVEYDINLETRVCEGSWIGAGVTLLPGVTIARGCVIAAGSVVHADTTENGLYAGVPAKRKKDLPIIS